MEILAAILEATSGATSIPMISSDIGMFDWTSDVYFPVLPSPVNQGIEAAGSSGTVISSADQLRTQIPDQQIQHWQSSYMSAAADSGISTSSLVHERQNEVQDIVVIPTSNPNSMPVEMESFVGEVDGEKDYYMHNTMLQC